MDFREIVARLDAEWDTDGFFDRVRNGDYDDTRAKDILRILRAIDLKEEELLPKRLVALLWYLPSFIGWQVERVIEKGGDSAAYQRFATEVFNTLEEVLGTP